MENKELVPIGFHEIEKEMQKYHPDFKLLSVKEIAADPSVYGLYSTSLDDHFTILVRSADKDSIVKAKKYLLSEGFPVLSSQDTYGLMEVKRQFLEEKHMPPDAVDQTIAKTAEYLGLDLKHIQEIGQNKEGDYYFYFYPLKKGVNSWYEFKQGTYLDQLNEYAKASHQSIDLIFAQLDNCVYGGLKLPGLATKEYYQAYFEAVNVQVNKTDKRTLYIACHNLMELGKDEEEVKALGLFQMFLVDQEIFYEENIEEIYLDFSNEVDDSVFNSL